MLKRLSFAGSASNVEKDIDSVEEEGGGDVKSLGNRRPSTSSRILRAMSFTSAKSTASLDSGSAESTPTGPGENSSFADPSGGAADGETAIEDKKKRSSTTIFRKLSFTAKA